MKLQQLTKSTFSLLLLLFLAIFSFAQDKVVTGTIRDADGTPIEGVTVAVKGQNRSVLTDAKGDYTIKVATGQTLSFTHIAYTIKEVKVNESESVNVSMEKSNASLEDVVIVGYGAQKKGHLTGSVVTIKSKEIEDLPVSNLGAALAGRILGLGVSGGTSRPGSTATLKLRNPETYAKDAGSTGPLFVIDGVIQVTGDGRPDQTQFNALDPSEIETISFLKDAAAAIYGSRAANGVVIVTTKRGRAGAPRISYSGSYATNDEAYRTKMMSAYDYGIYYNIMNGKNGGGRDPLGGDKNKYFFSQDELDWMQTVNYDWLEPAWQASHNMRHTLNVSGGTEKANFFASASYYAQDGNLGTLDYKKWTFRAGADMQVASGLKVGLQVAGNYSDRIKTFNKIGGENDENDYRNLLLTPRYVPMYIDGKPVKIPGSNSLAGFHFYEIQRLNNLSESKGKTLNVNVFAEYEMPWVKNLKFRVNYARYFTNDNGTQIGTRYQLYDFNKLGTNQHIFDGATVLRSANYSNGNRLTHDNINGESEQTNFTASYARQFGQHNISALASVEKGEAWSQQAQIYKDDPLQSTNGQFQSAFGAIDGKTEGKESGTLGYIGRLNYNYASKYLFEFLYRTDASTHFAPENYWGQFYAVSAGWVISSEKFFNVPAVNFLKLRASAGQLGRDDTKAWQWRQRYTYQNGKGAVFGGNGNATTGMKMEVAPNRNATWSKEFKYNLGIDAAFLNNRLSATVEGFYNKATDMLMEREANVPITVGGSMASENWGKQDFYGYELSIGWNDNIGKDFTYGIDARFTWYDNKWHQGDFNDLEVMRPWMTGPGRSADVGAWGHDVLGMFKSQEEIDAYVKEYNITEVFGETVTDLRPGMLYYRDIRGKQQADGTFTGPDGIIDEFDQVKLAKRVENHYGLGFTLRASYKGFGLDCVIGGSFGGWSEIDGDARERMEEDINTNFQSRPAFWSNIYDPELNPEGKYPNPYWSDINLKPRSAFWRANSFRLGMRNANLNYSLPKRLTNAMRISNARIAFTVLNAFNLFNPFDYKAPDGAYDVFPALRTMSLGVNLTL
jgi:TonB-linked SusC/RagA family outer membrane protein